MSDIHGLKKWLLSYKIEEWPGSHARYCSHIELHFSHFLKMNIWYSNHYAPCMQSRKSIFINWTWCFVAISFIRCNAEAQQSGFVKRRSWSGDNWWKENWDMQCDLGRSEGTENLIVEENKVQEEGLYML